MLEAAGIPAAEARAEYPADTPCGPFCRCGGTSVFSQGFRAGDGGSGGWAGWADARRGHRPFRYAGLIVSNRFGEPLGSDTTLLVESLINAVAT